jgi:hypothetical protein
MAEHDLIWKNFIGEMCRCGWLDDPWLNMSLEDQHKKHQEEVEKDQGTSTTDNKITLYPVKDPQVEAMVADPEAYFKQLREDNPPPEVRQASTWEAIKLKRQLLDADARIMHLRTLLGISPVDSNENKNPKAAALQEKLNRIREILDED